MVLSLARHSDTLLSMMCLSLAFRYIFIYFSQLHLSGIQWSLVGVEKYGRTKTSVQTYCSFY